MSPFKMLALTAICILHAVAPAAAQSQHDSSTPESASCAEHLVSYLDWPAIRNPSWSFVHEIDGGGALHYFGAVHSDDPAHPQFNEIAAAYDDFQPTVIFYEGPKRPTGGTREETITKFGESGFIRFLATRDGIEIRRLEPNPVDEMNEVLKSFTPEEAGLFFLLREASRLRERKDMDEHQIAETISGIIGQASQMMPDFPFQSTDDLQRSYAGHWSEPPLWWQAPSDWFSPTSDPTDDLFTHRINRTSSEFRNRHMYEILAAAALDGERVFAVVGRNHVPMQAPALKCAFGL